MIGQGLSGTIDLKTLRPLDMPGRSVSLNARYESNSNGALNAGSSGNGVIVYEIVSGNANGAFAVDTCTGQLRVAPVPGGVLLADRAAVFPLGAFTYGVTVNATDSGAPPLTTSVDLNVTVERIYPRVTATLAATVSGAAAANALGLTSQVPVRSVYLTSGPSRTLRLGRQSVEMRHAPAWQLVLAGRPAGEILRALAWLGPSKAEGALVTLRRTLPASDLQALAKAAPLLPTWLAQQVSQSFAHV